MTVVSNEDRDAMARILAAMNGDSAPLVESKSQTTAPDIEIGGPGVVTTAEIDAMANVMNKLNKVTQQVMLESNGNLQDRLDVRTSRNENSVKVGEYTIGIRLNERRLAGKQYYTIEHTSTKTVIADDITLYETALTVVKLLNNSHYVNHPSVRKLFELDDRYTSHRISAMSAKISARKAEKNNDTFKKDIYESKVQASLDQALNAKKDIKQEIAKCR